jgi:two-component system, sensor histidine kinase and response regulator
VLVGVVLAPVEVEAEPSLAQKEFDLNKGVMLWGDQQTYLIEVDQYLQEAPRHIEALQAAIEAKDHAAFRMMAHANKGVSANLALPKVQSIYDALEHITEERWQECPALLAHLKTTTEALQQTISALLADAPEVAQSDLVTSHIAADQLLTWLQELRSLAAMAELDDSLANKLLQHAPTDWRQPLHAITQSLNDFDFEQAVIHIDALLEAQTQGTTS